MSEFLIVQRTEDERPWSVDGFTPAVPRYFRLRKGVRLLPEYPANVVLDLAETGGDMRVDFIRNHDRVVLASSRAREVLVAGGAVEEQVEYLPVTLRDKKKRVLDTQYFIVNPVVNVACMDRKRSEHSTYSNSDQIMHIERLYLDDAQIPKDTPIFRLAEDKKLILIRRDLLAAIQGAGLVGLHAVPQGEAIQ